MTQHPAVGIQLSIGLSALGNTAEQIRQVLTTQQNSLSLSKEFIPEKQVWVGAYQQPLIENIPEFLQDVDSRNLRFALTALAAIETALRDYADDATFHDIRCHDLKTEFKDTVIRASYLCKSEQKKELPERYQGSNNQTFGGTRKPKNSLSKVA